MIKPKFPHIAVVDESRKKVKDVVAIKSILTK
jgi:hypothetical protein